MHPIPSRRSDDSCRRRRLDFEPVQKQPTHRLVIRFYLTAITLFPRYIVIDDRCIIGRNVTQSQMSALVQQREHKTIEAIPARSKADHGPTVREERDRTVQLSAAKTLTHHQHHTKISEGLRQHGERLRPRTQQRWNRSRKLAEPIRVERLHIDATTDHPHSCKPCCLLDGDRI